MDKMTFYIRYNKSIHAEFPANFGIWLHISGTKFENRGTAPTREAAEAKARKIASRAKRGVEFVEQKW